jgi:molecular chaperone DnaK
MALQRIKEASEKAKKELSSALSTNINLPFIYTDNFGPKHMDVNVSRVTFESIINDLVEKTKIPVSKALEDSGLKFKDLDKILLVGGSTRIPIIQKTVKDMSGIEPSKVLNPDECVALGAAIQGDTLSGNTSLSTSLLLLDVTPLTLSIELANGESKPLIKRNSTIPTSVTDNFTTNEDFQDSLFVKLYQGERLMAKDNFFVGSATISDILPAKKGVPSIDITFYLDENGIIKISAIDKATNKKTNAVIKSKSLSQFDIDKAMQNAAQYEEADRIYKEKLVLLNKAEDLIYKTKQNIDKYNFDEETKKNFNYQIDELNNFIEKGQSVDIYELENAIKTFSDITGEYYTSFYQTINQTNDNPYTSYDDGFEFYNKF